MTKRLRFINSKVKKIKKLCFKKLFDIKSQNTPKTMQTIGKVAITILWSGLLIGKKMQKNYYLKKVKSHILCTGIHKFQTCYHFLEKLCCLAMTEV